MRAAYGHRFGAIKFLCTNCEIGSVMLLQMDTMDQIPMGFFMDFLSLDILVWFGGWQKSTHISPFLNSRSNFLINPRRKA